MEDVKVVNRCASLLRIVWEIRFIAVSRVRLEDRYPSHISVKAAIINICIFT